jgi:Flp pilus assembly pilin Flp
MKYRALRARREGQMQKRIRGLAVFLADRRGITALEYGIVASWLAFVVVVAFTNLGADLTIMINKVATSL